MYGKPNEMTTHMSLSYFRSPESPRVHIDLFVGGVEGDKYVSPSWGNKNIAVRCEYPHSGWQYIDFFGYPILAQIDQHTLFTVQYGADYMIPRGNIGYFACYSHRFTFIRRSAHPSTSLVHLLSFPCAFRSMCTVDVADCPSVYTRELPLSRMLQSIRRVAAPRNLLYTAACDTLQYVVQKRKVPPAYGAIAIHSSDASKWITALETLLTSSTYVIEYHKDGSIAHLRYSHINPVEIAIFPLPESLSLNLTEVSHGTYSKLPRHQGSPDEMKLLGDLCLSCDQCKPYQPKWKSGHLRNQNSNLCVERAGSEIHLSPCLAKVCPPISG
jgi:hypothetical protein